MEKNTVTCPGALCHSWQQNVDTANYHSDRHTKPYAYTHTHRPRRTRIPFQFTQQTCTQHINQLALAKTFEIDFKFFGPLFLYATKGQFFVLCLQGHVWHLHTHTHYERNKRVGPKHVNWRHCLWASVSPGQASIAFCLTQLLSYCSISRRPQSHFLLALAIDSQFSLSAARKFSKWAEARLE